MSIRSRRVQIAGAAIVASLVIALAGCSGPSDELAQSRKDAVAAVGSAALATSLHRDGRAPTAWLATQYGDELKELGSAEQSVEQLDTKGRSTVERARLLRAIRAGIEAVKAAQRELNAGGTPPATALKRVREQLR